MTLFKGIIQSSVENVRFLSRISCEQYLWVPGENDEVTSMYSSVGTLVQVAKEKNWTHHCQPKSRYWEQNKKMEMKPKPYKIKTWQQIQR